VAERSSVQEGDDLDALWAPRINPIELKSIPKVFSLEDLHVYMTKQSVSCSLARYPLERPWRGESQSNKPAQMAPSPFGRHPSRHKSSVVSQSQCWLLGCGWLVKLFDLHIDGIDGLSETLVDAVSELRPDLCIMTGDYRFDIEGSCERAHLRMRSLVGCISWRCGILGILGNHDPSETAFALEEMGVRVLINDAAEIHRGSASISFIGVDDPYDYKCDDLESALAFVPAYRFKILLAHAPDLYGQASAKGIQLYLCGHMHAGQVRLPWVGSVIRNSGCARSYSHGYWKHKGMQGYTSAGVGRSMLPVRFNCPPEIVFIGWRVTRALKRKGSISNRFWVPLRSLRVRIERLLKHTHLVDLPPAERATNL